MAKRRLTSTLGQATKALHESQFETEDSNEVEQPAQEVRAVRRGRDLLHAMAGAIHTVTVHEVPTGRCKMWKHHNRLYELLDETNCSDLIESYRTQGQVTPATARRCADDPEYDYEIVCGARRHWTACFLKRDLLLEVRELNDEEAFLLSDADNKDSQDISEYERGIEYAKMADLLYGGSQQRLASRVGLSKDVVSQYVALAELDPQIVSAYPDPRWIKRHHAKQIKASWSHPKVRERMLAIAKELAEQVGGPKQLTDGAHVLRILMSAVKEAKNEKAKGTVETFKANNGRKMLTVRRLPRGKINFEVERNSGATIDEVLEVLRRQLETSL